MAQFIKNKNARLYSDRIPGVVKSIMEHHYVDDWVDSFHSEQQAIKVLQQVIAIHLHAGFELHNFSSDSVRDLEVECAETNNENLVNLQGQHMERVLGMHWQCQSDTFVFKLIFNKVHPDILNKAHRPTKREGLSMIMPICDPFGLLADFVIIGKLLMQSKWSNKVSWDEQLPDAEWKLFKAWMNGLEKIRRIREPRSSCIKSGDITELHIFSDASEVAMAAVAYIRIVNLSGNISLKFFYAKTICEPIKYTSILRIELQAAFLAVRLKETVVASNQLQGLSKPNSDFKFQPSRTWQMMQRELIQIMSQVYAGFWVSNSWVTPKNGLDSQRTFRPHKMMINYANFSDFNLLITSIFGTL